jgi:hypothetical protein
MREDLQRGGHFASHNKAICLLRHRYDMDTVASHMIGDSASLEWLFWGPFDNADDGAIGFLNREGPPWRAS